MKQFKIDISQMGDVKIEQKDGFVIISPIEEEKPVEAKRWPEVGYFTNRDATVEEWVVPRIPHEGYWKREDSRNVYPYRQHAELFGQVLAPLLVKHYVLTGGYWEERPSALVLYCNKTGIWSCRSCTNDIIGPMDFPFPSGLLARQFLQENMDQLNKLTKLWQLK